MSAKQQLVTVSNEAELDSTVNGYIASGFVIQNRTSDSVVLFKKKEFNILWAVIGFLLCLLPLLIYLIVYATESDKLVEIRIMSSGSEPQWSEDGQYWWDGSQWVPRESSEPESTGNSGSELTEAEETPALEEPTDQAPEVDEGTPPSKTEDRDQ